MYDAPVDLEAYQREGAEGIAAGLRIIMVFMVAKGNLMGDFGPRTPLHKDSHTFLSQTHRIFYAMSIHQSA